MAGPGANEKRRSPVSPQQQAENEILSWLSRHAEDPAGAFKNVLGRRIRGSQVLFQNVDQPRFALAEICRRLVGLPYASRGVRSRSHTGMGPGDE